MADEKGEKDSKSSSETLALDAKKQKEFEDKVKNLKPKVGLDVCEYWICSELSELIVYLCGDFEHFDINRVPTIWCPESCILATFPMAFTRTRFEASSPSSEP